MCRLDTEGYPLETSGDLITLPGDGGNYWCGGIIEADFDELKLYGGTVDPNWHSKQHMEIVGN